jgi:diacylglycerol O-acyltransferase
MAGEALAALGRYTPFPVMSRGVRLTFGLPQREVVTVTTNVPGPRQPLYAMGRRLVEIIPYVPIATTVRTGISIFTYCDNVTFGVTGDFAANPDLDVLARGIQDGVSELLEAARQRSRPAPPKNGRRTPPAPPKGGQRTPPAPPKGGQRARQQRRPPAASPGPA